MTKLALVQLAALLLGFALARRGNAALARGAPLTLITVGSPLRDLYGACFSLLYRWLDAPPESFAEARPAAAEPSLVHWVDAYRSGDYVGRSIWTPTAVLRKFTAPAGARSRGTTRNRSR